MLMGTPERPRGMGPSHPETASPVPQRGWRRYSPLVLLAALAVVPPACGDSATDVGPPEPTTIEVVAQPAPAPVGSSVQLAVLIKDQAGNAHGGVDTGWQIIQGGGSLSQSNVATDQDGIAEVTWTLGTTAMPGQVTVTVPGLPVLPFSILIQPGAAVNLELDQEEAVLEALEATQALSVTVLDEHGNRITSGIDWESANDAVVKVSSAGLVQALAEGSAMVTASIQGHSDAIEVQVKQKVADLSLDATFLMFTEVGEQQELTATALDANHFPVAREPHEFQWVSLDPGVVSISETGMVTAVGEGETTVSASIDGQTAEAEVSVTLAVTPVAWVANAFAHTCAASVDGDLYCWGRNSYGKHGNLTDEPSTIPTPVVGGLAFQSVDTGGHHTCGVATDGRGYCWGRNHRWHLGDGTNTDRWAPTEVLGGIAWRSITTGNFHSCGVATDGTGYCWGQSTSGQSGTDFDDGQVHYPTEVVGGHSWAWIEAGGNHSCGVTTAGEAYCWGRNNEGQLGNGGGPNQSTPVLVDGGHTWEHVSTSQHLSCGLTTGGQVYCWGRGDRGGLGNGDTDHRGRPTAVATSQAFVALDVGPDRACALTDAGQAYCWGRQYVGDGTDADSYTPIPVADGLVFSRIMRGTAACGITTDAELYCWGAAGSGRVGDGTTEDRPEPVQVLLP